LLAEAYYPDNIRFFLFSHTLDQGLYQRDSVLPKRGHRVPLNRHARDLINEVTPLTGAAKSQAIRRNRKNLGITDFRPHDLRRTGATWITAVGLPKLYARLMLNHSDGERDVTGEVYVQYS